MKEPEAYRRAHHAMRENDAETAISYLDELIETRPCAQSYLRKCIYLLYENQDNDFQVFEKCLNLAEKATNIDEKCSAGFLISGQCLRKMNRPAEALRYVQWSLFLYRVFRLIGNPSNRKQWPKIG